MGLNINKLYTTIFIIFFLFPIFSYGTDVVPHANQRILNLKFYSEAINIVYDDRIIVDVLDENSEASITDFYSKMATTPYQSLLENLEKYKSKLSLNDWLYYELIRSTLNEVCTDKSDRQKELTAWFLLSKAGYNTRLTYLGVFIFVYVHSEENIFETPMIEEKGRMFINLSSIYNNIDTKGAFLNMLPLTPNPDGRAFSFDLSQLPNFTPVEKMRNLSFKWKEQTFDLQIKFDLNLIHMMENYPIFEEVNYIQTPLSKLASQSILPQLNEIIQGKTEKEALEILAIFTRSSFLYKEDNDYFGKNKPMIGDEVFYYPYSDCEDRSALFYYLVKELLHLPMIVIAYNDHLTIAVATSQPIGNPIHHGKRKYYICDPTGPSNSEEIGAPPRGYRNKKFEILEIN